MFVELCRNRECEGKHCQRLAAERQSEGRSHVVSKDMVCVVGRCCSDGIASAKDEPLEAHGDGVEPGSGNVIRSNDAYGKNPDARENNTRYEDWFLQASQIRIGEG